MQKIIIKSNNRRDRDTKDTLTIGSLDQGKMMVILNEDECREEKTMLKFRGFQIHFFFLPKSLEKDIKELPIYESLKLYLVTGGQIRYY